jgi:hypothetical protein
MKLALPVATVAALLLAAPAAAAPKKLSKADRAAITRSIDVFVNHAVKRAHTVAAYGVVAPEMRPGISRKQWSRGDIPVYPFPARGTTHPWNVLYVTREEVGLELQLMPRPHSDVGPIIFHIYLRPVHGRWLVDSFMPAATLAPLNAKHPKVRAVTDFSPQGVGNGASAGENRVSSAYIVVPFALVALILVGIAAWALRGVIRDRHLRGPRRQSVPPLPPTRAKSPGA